MQAVVKGLYYKDPLFKDIQGQLLHSPEELCIGGQKHFEILLLILDSALAHIISIR